MFGFKRTQVQPIGLDIAQDAIRMIQLERAGNALSVLAAARQSLALPGSGASSTPAQRQEVVAAIRNMMRHNHFHGRSVIAALPRRIMHVRTLRLPPMPASELAAAVRAEAKTLLPFDPAEACIQFLPAGEVRLSNQRQQEIILLAARNADVADHLQMLRDAGVSVDALDAEPCALYRGIERFIRRRDDEQDVYVIIDASFSRTLVVIGKGRDISFTRSIDIGGRHLNEAVSRRLSVTLDEAQSFRRRLTQAAEQIETPATVGELPLLRMTGPADPVRQAAADATRSITEDLVREISICFRYCAVTFRGQRPGRARLVGDEAGDLQLRSLLSSALAIPVEIGRPLLNVDTNRMRVSNRQASEPSWAMAFGLSLRRLPDYFGARDGRKRDRISPIVKNAAPSPETAQETSREPAHA